MSKKSSHEDTVPYTLAERILSIFEFLMWGVLIFYIREIRHWPIFGMWMIIGSICLFRKVFWWLVRSIFINIAMGLVHKTSVAVHIGFFATFVYKIVCDTLTWSLATEYIGYWVGALYIIGMVIRFDAWVDEPLF